MIVAKDANKITRLMGLTIMKASKNFKSHRLLRIFERLNSISKTFVATRTTGEKQILGKCED